MKSILSLGTVTALWTASNVVALTRSSEGCFSSSTGLIFNGTSNFNSVGSCGDACYEKQFPVMAMTNSTYCFCSETLPPVEANVAPSKCTTACPGYPDDTCGARGHWSVYLTGLTLEVTNAEPSEEDMESNTSSKPAATQSAPANKATSVKPAVVTQGGVTIVVTAGGDSTSVPVSTPPSEKSGGGSNTAAIAAGVVIGVLVIAGILGGLFFFMRHRKRRDIEEEYKRNAAVNSFIAGGKPPTSSAGASSFTDTRLDPAVMAQRRESNGSIADNQDYSRRILKVTNA
ncbi:uncharacterized protein L3040_003777 [Drepanopeziza brunnea f. sp. 'multigermtubi']|uniref:WSC domain containing protein n=1 Tax=Marssonina brunnea f. sp. multigermtubi (strain MB_m1) TaxID=1072389 RepID=K1WCC9_MARBU|nr:WSC domain containing protein [Drepanopeziza brunnea f. sp. 'multigermtubi' MB_m1]EKD15025.1 WSC domain containing protein [Drepanopeziza brunnea f. sp. 'multigermtubi' MB_m1]KAJ5046535.1 hypothetical protein L3040_003777 [Drepanopeziza brunnea f. sp. 'multigermtubi']